MAQIKFVFPWKGILLSYILCIIVLFLYLLIFYYCGDIDGDTYKLYGVIMFIYEALYPLINSIVLCLLYYIGYKQIFKIRNIMIELLLVG